MTSKIRIHSIDALRAVTMLLMIWVNDFWTLIDIPQWLHHMPAEADALGFSDVIFPAFLLIVGLSIPFAIKTRLDRGDSTASLLRHIASRTIALLVMGVYIVNLDNFHDSSLLSRNLWQILMILAFILIWNHYPKSLTPKFQLALKLSGVALLALLAFTFRSNPENGYNYMHPQWWGILGLIGWAYLFAAVVQVFARNRWQVVAAAWLFCTLFNIASFASLLDWTTPIQPYLWLNSGGSHQALTLAGALVSTLYLTHFSNKPKSHYTAFLIIAGLATLVLGFLLRPYWGISKIFATPSWTHICSGITLLAYAAFFFLIDVKGIQKWTRPLSPAGTATLTCYLVPYLAYPLLFSAIFAIPETLRTGALGLAKSLLFAALIITATGLLNRLYIKLKL